jgi:hypothetical protein
MAVAMIIGLWIYDEFQLIRHFKKLQYALPGYDEPDL